MKRIKIGFLVFFLFVACSKNDGGSTSSSNNETNWTLSSLRMRSGDDSSWVGVPNSDQISEKIVINNSAQAMTRTVSDSNCTLTLIYNFEWETDGMSFGGYSANGDPDGCQPSILHCPDSYETMGSNGFDFRGEISDDEKTLKTICSISSDGTVYEYTYVK